MKLTRTVAYAVKATLLLADSSDSMPVPCSRIATEGNMPERFLLQILRSLVNRGILVSTRGVDGGYRLSRPADHISLLDVIEAIEGPMHTWELADDGLSEESKRRLRSALSEITAASKQQLESITLASLLPPQTPLSQPTVA